ncbi:MAG: hypothetical protein ACFE9T_10355 [Promethearchaeota archaeon]
MTRKAKNDKNVRESDKFNYKSHLWIFIIFIGILITVLFSIIILGILNFSFIFFIPFMIIIEIILLMIYFHGFKNAINLEQFRGTGNKDDPKIIDSVEGLPKYPEIIKNAHYIRITNCKFSELKLYKSQNLTITNCDIDFLYINSCTEVVINDSNILRKLDLIKSKKVKIEKTKIMYFNMIESNNNLIINCEINRINTRSSQENIFK